MEKLLEKLTLQEKIRLCSGEDFWHTKPVEQMELPPVMLCDGPHGLRCQKDKADMLGVHNSEPATCFPTASITACSWDRKLVYEIGEAIANEAKAMGVGVLLGPGANIKRDVLCGRNFEYFSEDPFLSGKLAASFISGAEGTGVGTSVKHFALNNQEYKRFVSNSQVDMRTMREIYLTPFEIAVKEGKPSTVMCAYNQVNGTYCSDHVQLLNDILRREWGFQGLVVTDWGAMHDRVAAMRAGCDLNMPGGSDYMEQDVLSAVAEGSLPQSCIDQSATRVLKVLNRAKETLKHAVHRDIRKNHALARKAAEQSAVLLKNADRILPLKPDANAVLIGSMADKPRFQGAGSSHIHSFQTVSARQAMPQLPFVPGCLPDGKTTDALLSEAVEAAKKAEVAIVFAGLTETYECEGFDRADMCMPLGHTKLIQAVAEANPNTVVVLCCGSVVQTDWAESVKAILYMGLAGQASGEAAERLLYGKVCPSGKLAESWPFQYEDSVTSGYYRQCRDPQYREGLYVGYRYYDKAGIGVRWPFGYGLSYTEFTYSDLIADRSSVTFTITNSGSVAGSEIAQLYIAPPQNGPYRPLRELKGFEKVDLMPGESKRIHILLDDRSYSVWKDGWVIPPGEYKIQIGPDSKHILLEQAITIAGEAVSAPTWQAGSWYETPCGSPTQAQWEALYGQAAPSPTVRKGSFTLDNTLLEMREESAIARFAVWCIQCVLTVSTRSRKKPEFKMLFSSCADAPLRNLCICGGLKQRLMNGVLTALNGRPIRGIGQILGLVKAE